MNCGRPTVTAAQVSPSPAGISWLNGGECGSPITASVQTAKQEKETSGLGRIYTKDFPSPQTKKGV